MRGRAGDARMDQPVLAHPGTEACPGLRVLPAVRLPRRGREVGKGFLDRGGLELRVQVAVRLHERVHSARGIVSKGDLATSQRVHEAPDQRPAPLQRVRVGHEHELVVGRHAGLLHTDHARVLLALGQVDGLVVPEAAENRVDLAAHERRDEVEADVALLDAALRDVRVIQDGLQVRVLVIDSSGPHGLPLQILGGGNLRLRQGDDRRERRADERADGNDMQSLRPRAQDLGLVRDGKVDAPGGDLLERRRGIGGLADLQVEAGLLEVARGLPGIDRRVVGVREVVEHQLERLLGRGPEHVDLLAAVGEHEQCAKSDYEAPHASRLQGMASRSTSETKAKSAIAISVSRTVPAYTRGVCNWLFASRTRRPSPLSAPAHSPKTAPITDTVAAILMPLNRYGSDAGSSAFQSRAQRVAPNERSSFSRSGSTERSPSSALTTIGKKQISATIASFGPIP